VLEVGFERTDWIEEPLEMRWLQAIHDTCGIRCPKQSPSCGQLRVAIGVFGEAREAGRDRVLAIRSYLAGASRKGRKGRNGGSAGQELEGSRFGL
jgi:hypothetical protein